MNQHRMHKDDGRVYACTDNNHKSTVFTGWPQSSMARLDYNGGKFPTLPGSYNSPVYRPCTGGQDNPATAILISCAIELSII